MLDEFNYFYQDLDLLFDDRSFVLLKPMPPMNIIPAGFCPLIDYTTTTYVTSPGASTQDSSRSSSPNVNNQEYFSPQMPEPEKKTRPLKTPSIEKTFACPICKRMFARKHDLQRHIRVHTGDKPYSCVNCKKSFARTDALKRHLRTEDTCRSSPVIQALRNTGNRRYRNL